MHPPILRWAFLVALALCLAPIDARAGALEVSRSAEDPGRIVLDGSLGAAFGASAFDARQLVAAESVWFDETQRGPVAAPIAPLRELVLENPDEIALRHASGAVTRLTSAGRSSTVVDAWFLLAVPFLMPVILRRRQRRVAKSWADQLDAADEPERESALDAIARDPHPASSLVGDASPM